MAYREVVNQYARETRWTAWKVVGVLLATIIPAVVVLSIVGYGLGWFGEAQTVAREEFGPRAMLQKYEWFKDASAALDKKLADIQVYETRVAAINDGYAGASRSTWTREDREQINIWLSEVAGVKASYNTLASEYNAQMAKFNWRFANAGELPAGADMPLPREYKPYTKE